MGSQVIKSGITMRNSTISESQSVQLSTQPPPGICSSWQQLTGGFFQTALASRYLAMLLTINARLSQDIVKVKSTILFSNWSLRGTSLTVVSFLTLLVVFEL